MNLGIHLIEYPKADKNEWIDSVCVNREKSGKYVLSQKYKFKKYEYYLCKIFWHSIYFIQKMFV